jgi:acetyltransferase
VYPIAQELTGVTVIKMRRPAFERMFSPRSLAVVGATDREASVGRTLLINLRALPSTTNVYPINPKRKEVLGRTCHPSIASVPEEIDLAIIVTPAPTVPTLIGECVDAGVGAAVVISAGFKERGAEGAELERRVQEQLRRGSMRLIGPNCLGIMNPHAGLNATFSHDMVKPGSVAFLSQSGALLTAILDWSLEEQVDFSAIVSTGSMLDVGWGDLIDYFGEDPETKSILLYMESVGDARSFLSAARQVALRKPIIVIKAGRSEAASHAASSHTGAMTGSDEVFDAALDRCGVLRVRSISDLFHMAETLARQPRPRGPRLTIVSNAGGPGVLATDALIATGGELAPLSEESIEALSKFLSPHWSHANPIDILGDSGPEQYAQTVELTVKDPQSDGLLVVLAPQGMTDPAHVAEKLKPYAKGYGKPVLASWMGGKLISEGEGILNSAGIPTFAYPDTAARMFNYMWRYSSNLKSLYETPAFVEEVEAEAASQTSVDTHFEGIRRSGRTLLTEFESKKVLARYGIPVTEMRVARGEDEALACAREIGFPVVLKVHSETITHKSDLGGVKLNLSDEKSLREAYRAIEAAVREKAGASHFLGVSIQPMVKLDGYELILGSSIDPQFGPVLLFGSGGRLVEVYGDRALGLPPLTATLAQRLMERTRIFKAFLGVRGRPAVDLDALRRLLVRFSRLVIEHPWIKEIDINPLLASAERLVALDARIILHGGETRTEDLPRPAIRPYPMQYLGQWETDDGTAVTIRPIRPEDEPLVAKFHQAISDRSVYLRYFHHEKLSARAAHDRLIQKCFIDYDREMALVAERRDRAENTEEIVAIGRLTKIGTSREAELAVLVSDRYQHHGLGSELGRRLIQIARAEKLERISALVLTENMPMRTVLDQLGFQSRMTDTPSSLVAILELETRPPGNA